jgi:hypothetical protein
MPGGAEDADPLPGEPAKPAVPPPVTPAASHAIARWKARHQKRKR